MAALQDLVVEVRRLRKEYGVGEGQRVAIHVSSAGESFRTTLEEQRTALDRLARVGSMSIDGGVGGIGAHAVLRNGAEIFLPLEGVIDVAHERERLATEIARIRGQLGGVEKKLENETFVSRAPADVVGRERERARTLREQASKLEDKLRALAGAVS
jgi:valyl-tRNA synthetase